MELTLMNYRTPEGVRVAFAGAGRTKMTVIMMDSAGITARRVPMAEGRYMVPLDYPVKKAARKFIAAGRRFGINKAAKAHLTSLRCG